MKRMHHGRKHRMLAGLVAFYTYAAEFRVPGSDYTAQIRKDLSILPGGRVVRPFGKQFLTGLAPYSVGVSPSGKTIVTGNIGVSSAIALDRASVTVMVPGHDNAPWALTDLAAEPRNPRAQNWQGVSTGLAVVSDAAAWVSEGDTGRVVEINLSSGTRKAAVNLNAAEYSSSFTDRLALVVARNLLFVLDQANFRVAIVDIRHSAVIASVKTGPLPVAMALSEDAMRLYVANAGTPEGASLSIVDVSDPAAPKGATQIPLAAPPSGIAVHGDDVYVSMANDDAVAIIDGRTGKITDSIPLRIPGLESLRGITPLGLAFDGNSGRLLVAEAGINAVAVIDTAARKVIGHVPVGWFPCCIQTRDGQVYVANTRGAGTGPSAPAQRIRFFGMHPDGPPLPIELEPIVLRRGTVSVFQVPDEKELAHQTLVVMQANGFTRIAAAPARVPPVRHVIVIAKGNRSFDEILGDIATAGDRAVLSESAFARYGSDGYVAGGTKQFSLRVDVTPNHHEIASRWSFSDNFYADGDYASSGQQWLKGIAPGYWSETGALFQEAGNRRPIAARAEGSDTLWDHLTRHKIDFLNAQLDGTSDQMRASRFIDSMRKDYLDPGKDLPQFVYLTLPNDTAGPVRPLDGFPYEASYVAANDLALGRIVEFLSQTPWWHDMAIFVTESGAEAGADHVDSHRMLLLGAGPWFRSGYVSHTNASFPSLLRTVFRLLDVPPLNLYDATAADVSDMFANVPDFSPYRAKPEDPRLLPRE